MGADSPEAASGRTSAISPGTDPAQQEAQQAMTSKPPRGYFAIGVEGLSKPGNLGNLMRTAHAFGAAFAFTVDADRALGRTGSDTSRSAQHMPYFAWPSVGEMDLPAGCKLVGVELLDDAVELPSFGHPLRAAYVLGSEAGSLSPQMVERCDHVIKIPTAFCINVATAGAIVMYDRVRTMGRFAERPVASGAPSEDIAAHVHGKPRFRSGRRPETIFQAKAKPSDAGEKRK